MRMLVSCRLVGAHRDGHQHGVSIQISINLGKKSIPISCLPESWDSLCKFNFFLLPDSELYLVNGFDFYILISFEWRDTENQQYVLFFQFRKAGIQLLSSGPSFNQCQKNSISIFNQIKLILVIDQVRALKSQLMRKIEYSKSENQWSDFIETAF